MVFHPKLKTENVLIFSPCRLYDIVYFCEIKCVYSFTLAGFKCVRSKMIAGEESRGGVAVLFKSHIWNDVHSVCSLKDQVWFRLASSPGFYYGAVYVAPKAAVECNHPPHLGVCIFRNANQQ